MKFKLWFEIILIVLLSILTIVMFLVPDTIGCLICLLNIFIFVLIDTYGTIFNKLADKVNGVKHE